MNRAAAVAATLTLLGGSRMAAGQASVRGAQTTVVQDTSKRRHRWPHIGLAIGPGIGWQHPTTGSSENETSFVPVWALFRGSQPGRSKAGLIPAFKIFLLPRKTAAVDTLAPRATILRSLKIRPVMIGLGWSQPITPRLSAVITGTAGRSFNDLGSADHARHSPQVVLPASPLAIGNSFVWEAGLRFWYNLRPKVTVITGISFLHTRPKLTFADGSTRAWNADQVGAGAGVAFTIFSW